MSLLTYLDASGSGADPKAQALSASGFVASENQWSDFNSRWPAVLHHYGVTEFHMRDFAHNYREFERFRHDEPARRAFVRALATVIRDCTLRQVGATIELPVYRWFNERFCIEEHIGKPYTFAIMMCIAEITEWRTRERNSEPVKFYVEKGDNDQGDLRRYMARFEWQTELIDLPVFVEKRRSDLDGHTHFCWPFQACDFLAYEHSKAVIDAIGGKITMRKSAGA